MTFSTTTIVKKYRLLTVAFLIGTVAYILPSLSCKVGLGGTIDTTPPSNTITYPPKNAVVRSTFVIAGTCNDDLNVESVTVNITNTDTRKSYGPFQADLASDKKSWSIKFNKEKRDVPNHPYAGWDYPDGHYSVTAYATDTSGKNSDTTANAFIIDNTPPVLILTSPSSAGTLEPDKFGRTISFTGTYAEDTDNKIAEMKVRLFKKSDSSKIGEITFQNIDHMAENNKYVIAQYFSKSENDLTDEEKKLFENYKAIFGETSVADYKTNGTAVNLPVYMTVLLSDGARVYDDPSNPSGTGSGNETTHYYRNTDEISNNFTKENAKYPMSIFEIKDFLNGTSVKYPDDTAVANIKNALKAAQSAEYNAEETSLIDTEKATTLSINPKANPTFIVSGYEKRPPDPSVSESSSYDDQGFSYYTNSAPFTIVISSGPDKVPVHYTRNDVTIYAVPANPDGSFKDSLPSGWALSDSLPPPPSDWIKVEKIENQANKTSYTVTKELSGLIPKTRYRFVVWGKDINGMPIEEGENGPYVFVVKATGDKPVILIGAQDTSGGKNTNLEEGTIVSGKILTASSNQLIFNGTATSGPTEIKEVRATVISINDRDTLSPPSPNPLSLSSTFTPPSTWETVITAAPSLPVGNYKVQLRFTAEDKAHVESSVTRTIYIDNKSPAITVDNIHTGDLIMEENSYIQTIKDSGGNITGRRYSFRGKWSDKNGKGTKTLEYSTGGGATWHPVTDSINGNAVPEVTSEASWTANIDVSESNDYRIRFRAIDDAGLQTELPELTGITFDFSAPTITPLEAKVDTSPTADVAGKYVNKAMVGKKLTVKARVSDTFSLGSTDAAVETNITATAKRNGTSYTAAGLTITKTPSADKKSATVTFDLPIPADGTKDGAWTFTVKAKDAAGRDAAAEQSVNVTVDTVAPTWKTDNTAGKEPYISPEGNTSGWYNKTALQVKALAEDTSIDKLQYKLNSSSWTDVGNGDFTFTENDGFTGKLTVRAIDKAGNAVEKELDVKIDTAAPDVCTLGTVDGQSGVTAKLVNGTSPVVFKFTASDHTGGSGLKSAEVVKIGNTPMSPAIATEPESGSTYKATVPKEKLADGAVTVRLTDNAGNTTDFALFTLQLDTAAPTVQINTPASGATVNKTITVSGTAFDNREIASNAELSIKTGANNWETYGTAQPITDGVWTFTLDTNNTNPPTSGGIGTYDSDSVTAGRQLTFKITAKDAAGNEGSTAPISVTVDQNTDRPVIRFTNVPLTGMTAATPVWLKSSHTLSGSITDDDGEVQSLEYKYSTENDSEFKPIPVSGGAWNLTLSDNTEFKLHFKVKDAKDTEFTSSATDSPSAPKLTDGTVTFGEGSNPDSTLYLKVDTVAPTITLLEAKVDTSPTDTDVGGKYVNNAMIGKTLKVTAAVSDTFSLGSDDTAVKANITATAQYNGNSYTASDLTITKTPSSDKKSADVTFELTIPSDGTKDGAWTFDVSARDEAENPAAAVQSVGVTVDTIAPTWKTDNTANKAPYISPQNSDGWSNSTSLLVKALAEDTSGIEKLQYKLGSSSWTDIGNGNFTVTASDGFNGTLTVSAKDKAGNSFEKDIGVKIDTAAPAACTLGTVDGQNGVTAKLVTGTSPVVFTFTASDAGASGIKSVEVVKIGNTVPSPAITVTESGGTYTATVPAGQLADGAVTIRLTDNAGNTADFALFTLQLDTAAPTVKINTPASGATVNKTITVSGTAVDNREIADKVEIFIKTGAGTDDWEAYKTTPAVTDITDGSWKFKLNTAKDDNTTNTAAPTSGGIGTYDSDSGKPGRQLTFKITAKDAAGNTGSSEEATITVDQNTDRPLIRLTNVPLTDMTASNPVWLKGSNIIYGSVIDDDGEVKSLNYSTNNGTNWDPITVSGGAWSLTLPDGSSTILFKVKDAKDTEFTSLATDSMSAPRLADGTSPKLYLNVDTHVPEMRNVKISTVGGDNDSDWSSDFKTVGAHTLMLGGNTKKFFIKFDAKDANGIDENKLSVKVSNLVNGSGAPVAEHTYTTAVAGANATHVTVVSASTADGWKTYTFSNIPCNTGSGTMKLEIVATDKAGNTSPIAREAKVDNTAPKVEFSSPITKTSSGTSPTKGDTRVSGEIDDSKAEVWFAVSPSETFSPDSDSPSNNLYKYVDSLDIEYQGAISSFDPNKTKYEPVKDISARWYVIFDGDTDPAATGTHSGTLNQWLIDLGITTQTAITSTAYDKITRLYVWIKAKDAYGNISEQSYPIWHDPQGDRPSVTIDYPANNAKLGGTVRLAGNAADNVEPKAVFVQILSGNTQIAAGAPTAAELNYWKTKGYHVYPMSGDGSAGTEWNGTLAAGKTAADYGILATLNGGSWSLTVNENGEFNPSGNEPNKVKIIAYAYDGSNNKSLPRSVSVTFDKNNPVFKDVFLVKSDNELISTANSAQQTTASGGTYSVKDTWYIYGTVNDGDTVKTLTIKDGSVSHQLISESTTDPSSGKWDVTKTDAGKTATFKYKLNTATGVGECPIEIEAKDATSQEYSAKYNLTIKYDNTAPVLLASSATGYNIKPEVSQSDSFYTFGSTVREDAVGGFAQSGFKRLAFFFMRRTGGTFVYDPMLVKTKALNKLSIGDVSYDSGLYWKTYSGVSWSNSNPAALTFTKDDNVHVGGLVQVNGAIYRIQSVSATGITLDTALAVDSAHPVTTVKVAIALIVDHVSTEGGVSSASLEPDGYYSAANLFNDDGDRMIESVSKTGTVWTWEASICSRNIPDGPIELHYVAFDEAGNYSVGVVGNVDKTTFQTYSTPDASETHLQADAYAYDGTKPAFVSNNRPRIAGVIFGTDYNGNGSIEEAEKLTAYRAYQTKGEYDADHGDNVWGITSITGFTGNNSNDKTVYDPNGKQKKDPNLKADKLKTELTLDVKDKMTIRGYTEITPEIVGGNGEIYYEYNLPGIGQGVNKTAFIASGTTDYTIAEGAIKLQFGDILKLSDNAAQSTKDLIFTFWDSTEGAAAITASGNDWQTGRQNASLKVKMTFAAKTPTAPKTTITPFYWNNENDNSLFGNSRDNGHIEIESGLPTTFTTSTGIMDKDPKVSGQIVMHGSAHDDSFIEGLYISVPGMESTFTSAGLTTTQTVNSVTYYKIADGSSGSLTGTDEWSSNGFKFECPTADQTIGKGGHDAKWTFSWDTSKITGVAKEDVEVHVLAYNKGTPTCAESTSADSTYTHASVDDKKYYANAVYATPKGDTPTSTQTTEGTLTNRYRMDVVPYISEIKTGLGKAYAKEPSVFNRSATGAYPVRQGETIQILGFNIGTNTAKVTIPGMTSDMQLQNYTSPAPHSVSLDNTITLTGAKSGDIVLKVGTIEAINNKNANPTFTKGTDGTYTVSVKAYNAESNGINNTKLTDDRKLVVWKFADVVTSSAVRYPTMRVGKDANQTVGFVYDNGAQSVRMNNGSSDYRIDYSFTQWYDTAVAVDKAGRMYGSAMNGDSGSQQGNQGSPNSSPTKYANYGFYAWNTSNNPGEINYRKPTSQAQASMTYFSGTKKLALENSYNGSNFSSNRIKNPKIAVSSDASILSQGKVYTVYYESLANQVRFRYGTVSGVVNSDAQLTFGGALKNHGNNAEGSGSGYQVIAGTGSTGTWSNPSVTNTGFAGEYVAVGISNVTSTGLTAGTAVAAWYDASGQRLLFSYNDDPSSSFSADQWGEHTRVIDSDFAGWYVDMVVDTNGGIHIAYYGASGGDLKYAYLSNYKDTAADIVMVDSYLSVGTNISIDVMEKTEGANTYYVPYISYFMSAFTKTKYSVRTAWLNTLGQTSIPEGVKKDEFTGDWEVMTIPTNAIPLDYTVGVGIKKNGSNNDSALVGYGTTTGLQTAALE